MTNKSYYKSPLQIVATMWMILCCAVILVYALANPHAEWDMLAYAASAESLNTSDPEVIHNRVYSDLRERLSDSEFSVITDGNHYRKVMYQDAEAFAEQLPYYSIRITFNTLLATVHDFGVSVYDAGYWVSAIAFVTALLVLWGALNDRIHPLLQMVFPLVFYKYTMDFEVIRQIFADSLASVWVVFICIAYLRKSNLLLPMIALSVFVRVDLIIFSGLLLVMLVMTSNRKSYLSLFTCGLVLISSFLIVQHWAGSYGWKTLYYFAIISDMIATHPSVYSEIGFTFKEYLTSLVYPHRWVSKVYWVTALFSMASLLVWKLGSLNEDNKKICRITAVCLLYIVAHYLIFPQMYLRFFVGQNLVIFAGFATLCTHYWNVYVSERQTNDHLQAIRKITERNPSTLR